MTDTKHPKPSVRPDWKMPEPPHPDCRPYFYVIGGDDGIDLYWATPEQAENGEYWSDEEVAHIDWPFGEEDWVEASDFVALGFIDVEG